MTEPFPSATDKVQLVNERFLDATDKVQLVNERFLDATDKVQLVNERFLDATDRTPLGTVLFCGPVSDLRSVKTLCIKAFIVAMTACPVPCHRIVF